MARASRRTSGTHATGEVVGVDNLPSGQSKAWDGRTAITPG